MPCTFALSAWSSGTGAAGVLGYLVSMFVLPRAPPPSDPVVREEEEGYDDEVAELTAPQEEEVAERRMQRTQRGLPQMPQMRPTHFQGPPPTKQRKAQRRPPDHEEAAEDEDEDPMFQALDE